MSEPVERIEPGHPAYDMILIRYRRDNGIVLYNGKYYQDVMDNDHLVFVRVKPPFGFDSGYEGSTLKNG